MKKQNVEEFLKERLLINQNGDVQSPIDEVIEVCKMLVKQKCKEQRIICSENFEYSNFAPEPLI